MSVSILAIVNTQAEDAELIFVESLYDFYLYV